MGTSLGFAACFLSTLTQFGRATSSLWAFLKACAVPGVCGLLGLLLAAGPPWTSLRSLGHPGRPSEDQQGQKRPSEAQRRPTRPSEAQRAPTRPNEAQRSNHWVNPKPWASFRRFLFALAAGPPWTSLRSLGHPGRPSEDQQGQKRPSEAQRRPTRPSEAQRAPTRPNEAQRSNHWVNPKPWASFRRFFFARLVPFAHTLGGWGGSASHELLARILKAGEQLSSSMP